MSLSPKLESIKRADSYEYKRLIDQARRRVSVGDTITVDGRRGRVVDRYKDFVVLEFSVYCALWMFKRDRYRECFLWDEIALLL